MPRRLVSAVAFVAICGAGCGDQAPSLPTACVEGTQPIAAALRAAPGKVALADGTRLSQCVERARQEGDVQTLGALYTRVADDLRARMETSEAAALQLGYLIGATRRGARRTTGIHLELVRRLEQTVGLDGGPAHRRAAFRRGLAAGSSRG